MARPKKAAPATSLGELLQPTTKPGGLDHPVLVDSIPFRPADVPTWLPGGIDGVMAADRDPECKRCLLHRGVRTVCMASVAGPAGLPVPLLVLGTPTARDDGAGGMVQAGANALALEVARKHAVCRVTWGVRCAAGAAATEETFAACRPFLAAEIDKATRVVLFGPIAAEAALGVAIDARRIARARAVVRGVPCFVVAEPAAAARNRFVRKQFAADVAWALTSTPEAAPDGVVEIFLDEARALAWLAAVDRRPLVLDCEHWPKNPWAQGEFRLLCLGLCQDERAPKVFPESLLSLPAVRAELKRVCEDPRIPKVNQTIKHDRHVIWRALGADVLGVEWDTMIAAQLMDSDAPKGLGSLAWKVGFGGAKGEGQLGADDDE